MNRSYKTGFYESNPTPLKHTAFQNRHGPENMLFFSNRIPDIPETEPI